MNAIRYFIVCSKAELKSFSFEHDRNYFSVPIEVQLLYSRFPRSAVQVRDSYRGHEYPVHPRELKSFHQLTRKQQLMVQDRDEHLSIIRDFAANC